MGRRLKRERAPTVAEEAARTYNHAPHTHAHAPPHPLVPSRRVAWRHSTSSFDLMRAADPVDWPVRRSTARHTQQAQCCSQPLEGRWAGGRERRGRERDRIRKGRTPGGRRGRGRGGDDGLFRRWDVHGPPAGTVHTAGGPTRRSLGSATPGTESSRHGARSQPHHGLIMPPVSRQAPRRANGRINECPSQVPWSPRRDRLRMFKF